MYTKILIATLLSFQALCGQMTWQECDSSELKNSAIQFYSEELFKAGLFENTAKAKEAAITDWEQDEQKLIKYFTLLIADEPCGYFIYSIENQTAYIEAIYLEEAYRGQGLGAEILRDFEVSLGEIGIATIRLYVFAHNAQAFALYKKLGYEIETTYYNGNKLIGHHLRKNLSFKSLPLPEEKWPTSPYPLCLYQG